MTILLPTLILSAMGVIFGIALAFAAIAFSIKADGRIALVGEILPGANCAACGYNGCGAYAEAVVAGDAAANLCSVGGQETAVKIGSLLGIDAGSVEIKTARVKCGGNDAACGDKYRYSGIESCAASHLVQEGPLACGYGCLGFGDCVKACDYNAIYIHNGVADIIASRCTACGKCVDACPKKLIELFPAHTQYTVCCVNKDRGATTRRNCAVGCIACMRCTKVCRIRAVTVQNNVAVIDPIKCRQCGECVKICPQYSIKHFDCILRRSDSA